MTSSALPGALISSSEAFPRCPAPVPSLIHGRLQQISGTAFLDLLLGGIQILPSPGEGACNQDVLAPPMASRRSAESASALSPLESLADCPALCKANEGCESDTFKTEDRQLSVLLTALPPPPSSAPVDVKPLALAPPSPTETERQLPESDIRELGDASIHGRAAFLHGFELPVTTAGAIVDAQSVRDLPPSANQPPPFAHLPAEATTAERIPALVATVPAPAIAPELTRLSDVRSVAAVADGTSGSPAAARRSSAAPRNLEPPAKSDAGGASLQGLRDNAAAPSEHYPLEQTSVEGTTVSAATSAAPWIGIYIAPPAGLQQDRYVSGAVGGSLTSWDIESSPSPRPLQPVAVSGRMELQGAPLIRPITADSARPAGTALPPALILPQPCSSELAGNASLAADPPPGQDAPREPLELEPSRAVSRSEETEVDNWSNREALLRDGLPPQDDLNSRDRYSTAAGQPGAIQAGEAVLRYTQRPLHRNPQPEIRKDPPQFVSHLKIDPLEPFETAAPKSALRELAVQLTGKDGQRLDLQFAESGGGVNLKIRTADLRMQAELGAELRQFEADTQSRGWKTEMRPGSALVEDRLAPRLEDRYSLSDRPAQLKASEVNAVRSPRTGMQFGGDPGTGRQARDWQAEKQELMEMSALRRLSNKGGKA